MSQTPPALRIKNRWFKAGAAEGTAKRPAEHASAMAFIVWRVSANLLKRMRNAGFEIDAGPAYFAFLREVLVFLIAVADRMAHERLTGEVRAEFTVALVRHVARHLQENEDDLLGAPAAGAPSHADHFIDLYNELMPHYAEFGAAPLPGDAAVAFEPDFAFVRYLGVRLEPALPERDRRWVLDPIMDVEAPEAVGIVQRSMRGLFDPDAKPARRSGLTGD